MLYFFLGIIFCFYVQPIFDQLIKIIVNSLEIINVKCIKIIQKNSLDETEELRPCIGFQVNMDDEETIYEDDEDL